MKRHLVHQLQAWKNGRDRHPLLLLGARQVGKTWLMQEFGRTHFSHTAYVRFDNDPALRLAFEQDFHIPHLLDDYRADFRKHTSASTARAMMIARRGNCVAVRRTHSIIYS